MISAKGLSKKVQGIIIASVLIVLIGMVILFSQGTQYEPYRNLEFIPYNYEQSIAVEGTIHQMDSTDVWFKYYERISGTEYVYLGTNQVPRYDVLVNHPELFDDTEHQFVVTARWVIDGVLDRENAYSSSAGEILQSKTLDLIQGLKLVK